MLVHGAGSRTLHETTPPPPGHHRRFGTHLYPKLAPLLLRSYLDPEGGGSRRISAPLSNRERWPNRASLILTQQPSSSSPNRGLRLPGEQAGDPSGPFPTSPFVGCLKSVVGVALKRRC